jgi:hypothetical protein
VGQAGLIVLGIIPGSPQCGSTECSRWSILISHHLVISLFISPPTYCDVLWLFTSRIQSLNYTLLNLPVTPLHLVSRLPHVVVSCNTCDRRSVRLLVSPEKTLPSSPLRCPIRRITHNPTLLQMSSSPTSSSHPLHLPLNRRLLPLDPAVNPTLRP